MSDGKRFTTMTLRFDPEFYKRISDRLRIEMLSFQGLGERLLQGWLDDEYTILRRPPAATAVGEIPQKHRELVREFLAMLDDPDDAPVNRMITGHLRERMAERVRLEKQKGKK